MAWIERKKKMGIAGAIVAYVAMLVLVADARVKRQKD